MAIKLSMLNGQKPAKPLTLKECVEGSLTYQHYEDRDRTAEMTAEAFAKLVAMLHANGKLSDDDASEFIGYPYTAEVEQ